MRGRVKCIVDKDGYAIYFSRGMLPHNKKGAPDPKFPYFLHLGLQCYDRDFLTKYAKMPATPLQLQEDLEQLKVQSTERLSVHPLVCFCFTNFLWLIQGSIHT